jgi:hypothetical protein
MKTIQVVSIVRWAARIGSLISIGLFLVFLFGESVWPLQITWVEWLGLLLFPGGIVVGMVLGWWREGLGSLIVLVSLAAFYVEQFIVGQSFPRGPWFLLFALPGFLFAICWALSHSGDSGFQPPSNYRAT